MEMPDIPLPATGAAKPRLLVVEDHGDTLRIMVRLLTIRGYVVHGASTLAGALKIAAGQAFDLAMLDIDLGDGNGRDLLRRLIAARDDAPELGAIAVSGDGMPEDVEANLAAGFCAHLTKPVTIERIEEEIRRWTAR